MSDAPLGGWHWRNTMKPIRFFKFDYRVAYTLLLILLYPRYSTLALFFIVGTLSLILERKGMTMSAAIRAARCWMVGDYRPPYVGTKKRRLIDTGSR